MINIVFDENKNFQILNSKGKPYIPVRRRPTELFTPQEIYDAWVSCNKNKKNDKAAKEFEDNLLPNLIDLLQDINNYNYKLLPADAFIIEEPTIREVFAAAYRDRVVHHLIINELNKYFEALFIYNSYSCRIGKGNTNAVLKTEEHVNILKVNGPVFFLKIDLSGYFMSIDRDVLTRLVTVIISTFYRGVHYELLIYLITIIINTDITLDCNFKSPLWKWEKLPARKTLFKSGNKGIPIGDLTSQWFSNIYATFLDDLYRQDKYKNKVFYNRYVDDIVVLSNDINLLREFLKDFKNETSKLDLKVNNKKTLIRPVNYGIHFLGKVIYEDYTLLSKRNINKMYNSLYHIEGKDILSVLNSRVGDIKRYNCYNLIQDFAKKAVEKYPFLEFEYPLFKVKKDCKIPDIYTKKK